MAILINFFDNVILQAISEEIVPKVSFFKDRYFPTGAGDIFKANEVLTEYRSGDRKLAAFVDQKAGDIPIGRRSYEVHSYKPAYIAPSRLLTLDELTKRGFGEALYPGMDEAQRAARLLADDMNDMENRIARREEWMAAETMIGNGCVMQEYIDGATKGDSLVVKFYDGTSDHTYTASKKWNENGGDFWGDVKAMCRMLSARGLPAKDLILGTDVADYILTDERTRQLLDKNSGIVDLGVNHIKPLLADIMSFAVNELFPAVSPLISMIISLVGTTLINAIKLVVDVIHGLLPVIEPVIQGIVGLIKGIVSVTITVVNAIIGTLNKVSFTVPDWVPALGGKKFGFNLKEVAMPAFANGGFTHGVSIAGEAGTEAVISFKPSVHDSNVENWVRAGRMLGVSGEDATRAAGVRYFANGGFTDGSKEKLDNLIDFSKAYGKYALRSNGIRTTGDALSMLWTVANNSMSGDASLALAATSIAADVAPLLLNKYLGSDSPVTTALTEAAKNYNGGTVLSSWQDGVLTDTGTPLYVLPPRDTGRTLSEIPVSAYQNTPAPGGNGGSSPQFVFAPNITITGDADRQKIASIMEDEYEKFKAFMDKYNRENNRTRYA